MVCGRCRPSKRSKKCSRALRNHAYLNAQTGVTVPNDDVIEKQIVNIDGCGAAELDGAAPETTA